MVKAKITRKEVQDLRDRAWSVVASTISEFELIAFARLSVSLDHVDAVMARHGSEDIQIIDRTQPYEGGEDDGE